MSSPNELKSFIDRVLRIKEEQDELQKDIRDVYAEAKANGFDKTVMGKLVAYLRKVEKAGETSVSEQEDIFETYLNAYRRASGMQIATHTHEEQFDPITGEFISDDAPPASDAAPLTSSQAAAGEAEAPGLPTISQKATVATQDEATVPTSDDSVSPVEGGSVGANAGGEDVTASETAHYDKAAANVTAAASKHPALILRPHCQKPGQESCAGHGSNHCADCKVAMREAEKELA